MLAIVLIMLLQSGLGSADRLEQRLNGERLLITALLDAMLDREPDGAEANSWAKPDKPSGDQSITMARSAVVALNDWRLCTKRSVKIFAHRSDRQDIVADAALGSCVPERLKLKIAIADYRPSKVSLFSTRQVDEMFRRMQEQWRLQLITEAFRPPR